MTRSATGEQVAARIGFAEQWLARARGEVTDGRLARGVLTMVLAQAEVHHAMEIAGAPVSSRRRHALPVIAIGALAAVVLVTAVRFALPAPPPSVEAGPPIVRLAAPVGELLNLAIMPPPAPAPVVVEPSTPKAGRSVPIRASIRASAPQAVTSAAPPVPAVSAPPPAASQSAPPPTAVPAPAALPEGEIVSAGDLIDLVLIAGAALRTDSMRR